MTAFFTVAKTWTHPVCPLINDWIRKMWHMYMMEYCSAMRKDETFVTASLDLEITLLSKIRQTEVKNHMI